MKQLKPTTFTYIWNHIIGEPDKKFISQFRWIFSYLFLQAQGTVVRIWILWEVNPTALPGSFKL